MGTGTVKAVYAATEPATNKPARKVIVGLPGDIWTSFFIPPGDDPPIGATVTWGPHYAWIDALNWRAHKSWESDPDGPMSPP